MPTRCWRGLGSARISTTCSTSLPPSSSRSRRRATYDRFLKTHGVDAGKAAMFEDLARNLAVPHALGMTTVLVVPENTREVFREDWELEGRDDPHVDHVTDNLVAFLETLAAKR